MRHEPRTSPSFAQGTRRLLCVLTALALGLALGPATLPAQLPDAFENLKVLSKDIEKEELVEIMRSFSFSLGVRCAHCHVGEPQGPLTEMDFVSDQKQAKQTARAMMRMVQTINGTHLAKALPDGGRLEVSCETCHRGVRSPQPLRQELARALDSEGVEAAANRYQELRERYYGRQAYDFGERVLLEIASSWQRDGKAEAARRMLQLNAEHHPKSTMTELAFAQMEMREGNNEAAKKHLQRALEYDPENRFASRLLAQLASPEPSEPQGR